MDVQLKKGILELVILTFLNSRDYYGYELNKEINDTLQLNESTVYAILKKLISLNYCTAYQRPSENAGPPRKYYSITVYGKTHLKTLHDEWQKFQEKIAVLLRGREVKTNDN